MSLAQQQPIGVFDSGIGGLSVANAIYSRLPQESMVYFADTARVPYGPRSAEEIQAFSFQITRFLLEQDCKLIVVACNTATAAALPKLRAAWPTVPFVGMEPAVKPAAKATQNGRVGVLATASTIGSERYAELMARYAAEVSVWEDPCVGLVPIIEAGQENSGQARQLLEGILQPMLDRGIDTLVLGCTHYPFIRPLLEDILEGNVRIIDPAPAVARQVERLLVERQLSASTAELSSYHFFASGRIGDVESLSNIPFLKSQAVL